MKSSKLKIVLAAMSLVLVLAAIVPMLSGCANGIDVDTSDMFLVVYDGNGGYLGNKTATIRKMYCEPGSKIPDYPVDYSENQYTVSSLGLAMREGFNLMGWYASDDAKYTKSENGEYVYLSTDDGNGIFEINPNGEYVRKYEKSEDGDYIYVHVEEAQTEEDTYIYIDASLKDAEEEPEITDEPIENGETEAEAPEEITETEDGAEETENTEDETIEDMEDVVVLSVESGFYICNGEETIGEIDDDLLREAYAAAYEAKVYSQAEIAGVAGWQNYETLPEDYRELFAGLDRFDYVFAEATDEDEGLERYSIESGYASLYSIFVEDDKGMYVFESPNYVYAADDEELAAAQRYSISDRYVFKANEDAENPSFLDRYDATMDYWDFTTDTVTEDQCTWDGEKYVLTLNAHWVKKNTVYYHYENAVGQVDESWTRLLDDNITYVPLKPGDVIGKKEIVPLNAGHTFVGWSKTQGEYEPWDFAADVFPEGETELHLYAYYIEGNYTRIVSAGGLSKIGKDPDANYILVNDIDLGGKEYTSSPLGLAANSVFTGEFISFGKKITNFSYKLAPSKQQALDSSVVTMCALFPNTDGAKIKGLTVETDAVVSGLKTVGAKPAQKKDINFVLGGIVGKAVNTEFEGCSVTLTCEPKSEGALESDGYTYVVKIGGLAAEGNVTAVNCTNDVTCELDGSVKVVKN